MLAPGQFSNDPAAGAGDVFKEVQQNAARIYGKQNHEHQGGIEAQQTAPFEEQGCGYRNFQ